MKRAPHAADGLSTEAHGPVRFLEDRSPKLCRSCRSVRKDPIELGGIVAQFLETSTQRLQQAYKCVRQGRLECAEPLTGKAGKDLLDRLVGDRGIDTDKVLCF